LSEKLEARGLSSAALSGEMTQALRERTIERLKSGKLDIVVATDVAARGLDVERVTHVVNYDIPHDVEGYIHRIGRTGRAGRTGHAILFVMPRELRMLAAIERATRQPVTQMLPPSRADVADRRAAQFKDRITAVLGSEDLSFFTQLVTGYAAEHGKEPQEIAAALAYLAQKDRPLQPPADSSRRREEAARGPAGPMRGPAAPARARHRDAERGSSADDRPFRPRPQGDGPPKGIARYRIEVGHEHGVQPGNIVGAIANEAGIDAAHIGRINIFDAHSTVDLPEGMPRDIQQRLRKAWVCGQQLEISVDSGGDAPPKRLPPGVKKADRPRGRPQRPHRKRSHE